MQMLTTKDGRGIDVEELSWQEVNVLIGSMRPALTKVMERYDASEYKFYKANYKFGSKIIQNKRCYLQLADGDSIDFNDPELPDELAKDLNYNPMTEDPLGMILSKNSEFYLPTGDEIMSHAIIHPGEMFGVPRATANINNSGQTNSALFFNLNSGARYLFTLSRITSQTRHVKLQRVYDIGSPVPESFYDQGLVFAEIARMAESPWRSEVIYFPRNFINALKTPEFVEIKDALIDIHRESYTIWHNTSLIWTAVFNEIERQKGLTNYSAYSLFTSRQLFLIAANSGLGFKPATNEDAAPIKLLQKAYASVYGLSEERHSSIIMEPTRLADTPNQAVYYSLNNPILAQHHPETFKGKSFIACLDEIESITRIYQKSIILEHSDIPSLYNAALKTDFSFYHCNGGDPKNYKNILNSEQIGLDDSRFVESKNIGFPEHSPFFKGCVKISAK